jgi:uncharacterized protein YodC (DUF2158 family)
MEDGTERIGQVVMLLSGGPAMTILGYDENKQIICAYFDKNHVCHQVSLPVEVLKKYS